jgi:hypothetical protein
MPFARITRMAVLLAAAMTMTTGLWSQCNQSTPTGGCPTLATMVGGDGITIVQPMDNNAHITVDVGGILAADQSMDGPTGAINDTLTSITAMDGNMMSFNINSATTGTVPLNGNGDYQLNPALLGGTVSDPVIVIVAGDVATLGCTADKLACTLPAYDLTTHQIVAAVEVISNTAFYPSGGPIWSTYAGMEPVDLHENGHGVLAFGEVLSGDASNSMMGPYSDASPTAPTICDANSSYIDSGGAFGCDPTCDPTSSTFCECNPNDEACQPYCDPCDLTCNFSFPAGCSDCGFGGPDYETPFCSGSNLGLPLPPSLNPFIPGVISFALVLPAMLSIRRRRFAKDVEDGRAN